MARHDAHDRKIKCLLLAHALEGCNFAQIVLTLVSRDSGKFMDRG